MKKVDLQQFKDLYDKGLTRDEISEKMGIGERVIRRIVNELGLQKRKNRSANPNKYKNHIGKKYNHIKILGFSVKNSVTVCDAVCDCGNILQDTPSKIIKGKRVTCGKVGCIYFHEVRKTNGRKASFTGYKDIYGSRWDGWICGARNRKLPFEITIEYAWDIFISQNKKCALSGVDIEFGNSWNKKITASLDRIDSSKGYIEGNIQWVHKRVNIMKSNMSDEEFIEWCSLISRNKNEREIIN